MKLKSKKQELMFERVLEEELNTEYPLPKHKLRVKTVYPPQGKQSFYGIRG